MRTKKNLGDYGENLASDYLVKQGYKILNQKYFSRTGEADLVAEKDGQLVFVEVKTRQSQKCGQPEEAITRLKLNKLIQAAQTYLMKNDINHDNYRLDLIAIVCPPDMNQPQIRHYENIGCNY